MLSWTGTQNIYRQWACTIHNPVCYPPVTNNCYFPSQWFTIPAITPPHIKVAEWMIPPTYGPLHTFAQAGLYIACPDLFKTGQGRRKKDEKWTREKFFFYLRQFCLRRRERGGRGLETRRWHIGDVQRIWGWGARDLKGSCSLMMEILVCYRSCVGTSSLILDDSYWSTGFRGKPNQVWI